MDDATRTSLKLWLSREDMHDDVIDDFLREALARDAEHDQPVTPEWLDGEEARRLGFERVAPLADTWTCGESDQTTPFGRMVRVELYDGYKNLLIQDNQGCRIVMSGVPTIAQVRAAVFLATGRT